MQHTFIEHLFNQVFEEVFDEVLGAGNIKIYKEVLAFRDRAYSGRQKTLNSGPEQEWHLL